MRIRAVLAVLSTTALVALPGCVSGEDSGGGAHGGGGKQLRLDYAYYNTLSLVIKDQRWLENELTGTKVTWVFSAGSNKANESLRANAIDLGSTAGSAAMVARANGTPIKTVDVTKGGEWTALVVRAGSKITSVAQLKGKKVAATKGTDPYYFLLQALKTVGLTAKDVQVVNLQHQDGKTALERGDVDAWAGLDPYMAQTQLQAKSELMYRNVSFNSFNLLDAREDFIARHPELVQAVVNAYERARQWSQTHPEQLATLLARDAKTSLAVAKAQLQRTTFRIAPAPGDAQRTVLERILPITVSDGDVRSADSARSALGSLFEPRFATRSSPS
jgi:sulfonate transport system substrate-binding protein